MTKLKKTLKSPGGVLLLTTCVVLVLLAPCAVLGEINAPPTPATVRVGISLGLHSDVVDGYSPVQHHAFEGLEIWRHSFNNMSEAKRTTRDGRALTFELVVFENYGRFSNNNPVHEAFLRDQILNMSLDPTLDFVLPPVGTPWGTALRNLSYNTGHVPFTIGIADSREYWYALPGSYGAPTSALYVMSSVLPYLRVEGAKTSYVVRMNETFQAELCQGFIDQAEYHDIDISHTETVYFDYNTFGVPTTDAAKLVWQRIADDVVAKKDDVLVICDYGPAAEYLISLLKQRKHTPKAILLSYKYQEFADVSIAEYILLPQSYHPRAGFPSQADFVDSREYNSIVETTYGHTADFNNAQATLAGFLLSEAIMHATNSTDALSVETALRTLQLVSFMGRSRFDTEHRQLMDNLIIQRLRGSDEVIGPAVASQAAIIYPMPAWEERVFVRRWGHWTEIVGAVLMSIGLAFSIVLIVFLGIYWRHRAIMAASPVFCVVIILGSMTIYASNIVWMPNLASTATCISRAWVMPIGFMLLFGALEAKTHRISRIFDTKNLRIMHIPNRLVLARILAFVFCQIIMSMLMTTVGKIGAHIHVVDEWRPSHNYYECASGKPLKYLYGFNLAGAGILLVHGCWLAMKVRKLSWREYDESTIIHYATASTVIFAAVAVLIQLFVASLSRFIAYFIMTLSMFLGPTITMIFLFYSKYRTIYDPYSNSSHTTTSDNNTSRGGSKHYASKPPQNDMSTSDSSTAVTHSMIASGTAAETGGNHSGAKSASPLASSMVASRSSDYSLSVKPRRIQNASMDSVEMTSPRKSAAAASSSNKPPPLPLSVHATEARIEMLQNQRKAARKEIRRLQNTLLAAQADEEAINDHTEVTSSPPLSAGDIDEEAAAQ